MAYWGRGNLSGFDSTPVQMAGRFVGRKQGKWLFWDGTCGLWLPREHVSYYRVGHGAIVITIPQWLAKKAKRVPLRYGKAKKEVVSKETKTPARRSAPRQSQADAIYAEALKLFGG